MATSFNRSSSGEIHDRVEADGIEHLVFVHKGQVAYVLYANRLSIDIPCMSPADARRLGELLIACADSAKESA